MEFSQLTISLSAGSVLVFPGLPVILIQYLSPVRCDRGLFYVIAAPCPAADCCITLRQSWTTGWRVYSESKSNVTSAFQQGVFFLVLLDNNTHSYT